jgi:hypothetical protein
MKPQKPLTKKQLLVLKFKFILFCLFALCLVGAVAGGIYFGYLRPELRVTNDFKPTICSILDKRLEKGFNTRGHTNFRPDFLVSYSVQNKTYQLWTYDITQGYNSLRSENEAIFDKFNIGHSYTCWYDPNKPKIAVLKKGIKQLSTDDIMMLVTGSVFFLVFCLILMPIILVLLSVFIPLKFVNNKVIELMSEPENINTSEDQYPQTKAINTDDSSLWSKFKQGFLAPRQKKSTSIVGNLIGIFILIVVISQFYIAASDSFLKIHQHWIPFVLLLFIGIPGCIIVILTIQIIKKLRNLSDIKKDI